MVNFELKNAKADFFPGEAPHYHSNARLIQSTCVVSAVTDETPQFLIYWFSQHTVNKSV